MDRRKFIRLTGGGIIVAAAAASAGCTQHMPAAAIEPWQGPGQESDVRRWILGYAILAPHSHNLQSWLVDLRRPDEILLRCDLARLLPEADPFSRQIMMSHGTFLELLDIAARERGLRADISLFPEGPFGPSTLDQRPVARIRLVADPTLAKDPLFAQILHRRTNRSAYDAARPVPPDAWAAMTESVKPHSLRFGFAGLDQSDLLRRHRAIAAAAWRIELTTPRVIMETYKVLRVGATEIEQHRDGLFVLDRIPVLMSKIGLFDRSQPPAPDDYATTSQIKDFNAKLEATPGFLWMVSEGNDRVTQINAGRAYLRVQLAATAAGIALQPLSQALQEYPEQAQPYAEIRSLLGATQANRTVQMWARAGFAPPVGPAPRRGVDAQLIRA
ncbi:MAG: putative twin-arginine translocation pathway signal sequence domain protein [Proteobacteria bacterium]|nr:putative twin-arginine translocation pathway signal sequence domain protein [Pseudomonadota bacterium]